jgi:hypothetical protein
MARIQITDLNPSDSEFIHELTAEELLAITGGGWLSRFLKNVGEAIYDAGEWIEEHIG